MNTQVRRKLDMAARVREFTRARVATEPGYAPGLARFEELLGRADAILGRQHQGRIAARGARARRLVLRSTLHTQLVHYLVALGSVAAKDQADLAASFKLPPTNATNTAFLTAVKALLAAGKAQQDLLVKAGMAPTLLDELSRMVADFEAASEAARTARRDHIGARADLEVISAELTEQVKLLDGITRYRFGSDPEVMAEWKAARQVLGQRRNGEAPATPQPPAPQPGDVQQAA
jgi:hypothetical protein